MKPKKMISVVLPVFNEEGNIKNIADKLSKILDNYFFYEIIFIDDGSSDGTLMIIKELSAKNKNIKYISFSRNFGHQSALRAGLDFAIGDCVITLDADLQHPPELIPDLIKKWQEGYDIVYTIREDDPEMSLVKKKTANMFYWLINKFSETEVIRGAADYRLLDRSVVEEIKKLKENDLFIRGIIPWLGYRQFGITYMPKARNWGETKYTFKKMVKFALSGITGFSILPLRLSVFLGFIFAGLSFIYGLYSIYVKLFTSNSVFGWPSTIAAITFLGGLQMIMIGIIGEYIGRMFMEIKKRPSYIVKEKNND